MSPLERSVRQSALALLSVKRSPVRLFIILVSTRGSSSLPRSQRRLSAFFTSSCLKHEKRAFSTSTYEHHFSIDAIERLHDFRLVWALEVRPRLAAVESNPRLMGNRTVRVLFGGARKSLRLCSILRISTQDHSRGNHDRGLHRVRDFLSQREARLELSRGIRLPRCGSILRLCVQGTRNRHLKAAIAWGSTESPRPEILTTFCNRLYDLFQARKSSRPFHARDRMP